MPRPGRELFSSGGDGGTRMRAASVPHLPLRLCPVSGPEPQAADGPMKPAVDATVDVRA